MPRLGNPFALIESQSWGFLHRNSSQSSQGSPEFPSQAQTQRVADATVEAFTAALSLWFLVWPYTDHLRDRKASVFGNFWVQMQTMGMITVKGTLEIVHCSISASVAHTDHIISCYIFISIFSFIWFIVSLYFNICTHSYRMHFVDLLIVQPPCTAAFVKAVQSQLKHLEQRLEEMHSQLLPLQLSWTGCKHWYCIGTCIAMGYGWIWHGCWIVVIYDTARINGNELSFNSFFLSVASRFRFHHVLPWWFFDKLFGKRRLTRPLRRHLSASPLPGAVEVETQAHLSRPDPLLQNGSPNQFNMEVHHPYFDGLFF